MATVRIVRNSEYMYKFRNYGIYIDGVKMGAVSNAETIDIVVPEGSHTIYAKLDFGYSPELSFIASDKVVSTFNVKLPASNMWISVAFLVLILLRPMFERMTPSPAWNYYSQGIGVLVILYLVYLLTLGRKNRLVLTQDISTNDYVPYSK